MYVCMYIGLQSSLNVVYLFQQARQSGLHQEHVGLSEKTRQARAECETAENKNKKMQSKLNVSMKSELQPVPLVLKHVTQTQKPFFFCCLSEPVQQSVFHSRGRLSPVVSPSPSHHQYLPLFAAE